MSSSCIDQHSDRLSSNMKSWFSSFRIRNELSIESSQLRKSIEEASNYLSCWLSRVLRTAGDRNCSHFFSGLIIWQYPEFHFSRVCLDWVCMPLASSAPVCLCGLLSILSMISQSFAWFLNSSRLFTDSNSVWRVLLDFVGWFDMVTLANGFVEGQCKTGWAADGALCL